MRKDTTSVFDENKENRENKDYIWTMRKEPTSVFNENKENKENKGYTDIQESAKRLWQASVNFVPKLKCGHWLYLIPKISLLAKCLLNAPRTKRP